MADVKIIDIDNEQWNMKDQEARNRIANLETKTTVTEEVLEHVENSFISLAVINGVKFFHLHFDGNMVVSQIGEVVFHQGIVQGHTSIVRGFVTLDKTDGTGRIPADIDINLNGYTYIYPILPNQYNGYITSCKIYGDCFIKVM